MSRIFIWLESSSTLNFVSERDPDEILQNTHRMIEVPSVSQVAWAYCRTGKSIKILQREGRVGGVSRIA